MKKNDSISKLHRQSNSPRVLVADDDPTIRLLLRAALKQWGYQIVEAEDGEQAWEILQQPNPPQLLLLDWIMPKLDGVTLCKLITEKLNFHHYIIFLTSKSGTENIIEGLEAGADEFLLKPFDLAEIRIRLFAGERIIKYRTQLAEKNLELQKYIDNMKKMAEDHARQLVPFDDLAVILLKIHNALYPICDRLLESSDSNKPAVDKIRALQSELNHIIDVIKGANKDTSQIQKITQKKITSIDRRQPKYLIDMNRMHDFFGNDASAINDFIKTFISLSTEQLQHIEEAIKNKDAKVGKYYLHLLRGASGNSGVMKMYELCGIAEDQILKSNWELVNQYYLELVNILNKLQLEVSET